MSDDNRTKITHVVVVVLILVMLAVYGSVSNFGFVMAGRAVVSCLTMMEPKTVFEATGRTVGDIFKNNQVDFKEDDRVEWLVKSVGEVKEFKRHGKEGKQTSYIVDLGPGSEDMGRVCVECDADVIRTILDINVPHVIIGEIKKPDMVSCLFPPHRFAASLTQRRAFRLLG